MKFCICVNFLVIIAAFCSLVSKVYSSTNVSNFYSFVLACEATSNSTDANDRIWSSDSTYLPTSSSGNSITSKAKYQDPSLISNIPYMTARIFKTQTAYTFHVSSKSRHWIRLHFYPCSYDNFNCSNSFFYVVVAGFTLLNNFSASITAQALTQAYIIREFTLVPLQTAVLSITFSPSSAYKDSFAFINGIEIVSTPENFEATPMAGFSDQTTETQASSMQTMFRLNVGGQYIQANNDSGLERIWYDDAPYLFGASFGITFAAINSVKISYPSNLPNYIAPLDVYRTARSMGLNDTTGNLAGPNPVPPPPPNPDTDSHPNPSFSSNKTSKKGIIDGSNVGMAAGFGIALGDLAFVKRMKNMNNGGNKSSRGGWLPIYSSRSTETRTTISGKSSGSSHISNIGGGLCRHFTLAEIKHGTKNFNESRVIGVGGFGKVYRGEIDGGTIVAIREQTLLLNKVFMSFKLR